jgi:hypothetical protein
MKAICSSETSVDIQPATLHYMREGRTFHNYGCEKIQILYEYEILNLGVILCIHFCMFWRIRHHDETRTTAAISKNMARRGGGGSVIYIYISDVVQWPQSMRQQQTARNWQWKEQNEGSAASIDDLSLTPHHCAPQWRTVMLSTPIDIAHNPNYVECCPYCEV